MKRFYVLMLALMFAVTGAFAQGKVEMRGGFKFPDSKTKSLKKELDARYHNNGFKSAYERWYNFGDAVDIILGGTSTLWGLWSFPDSNMHVVWADGPAPLQWTSIADMLDPASVWFNDGYSYPGAVGISDQSTYSVDSLELWGIYVRNITTVEADSIYAVDTTEVYTLTDSTEVIEIADSTGIPEWDTTATDTLFMGALIADTILAGTDTFVYVLYSDSLVAVYFNGTLDDTMFLAGSTDTYETLDAVQLHNLISGTDTLDVVYTTMITDTNWIYDYDTTWTYLYDIIEVIDFDTTSIIVPCVDILVIEVAVNYNVDLGDYGAFPEFGTDHLILPHIPYSGPNNNMDISSNIQRFKIPMDDAFFADSTDGGWHVVQVGLDNLPDVWAGRYAFSSASFIPGYPFEHGDTLDNFNRYLFVSLEETEGSLPMYTDDEYNTSCVSDMEQRYGLNTMGWNGTYFPSYVWSESFSWEHHVIYYKLTGLTNTFWVGDEEVENEIVAVGNAYPNPAAAGAEVFIPFNLKADSKVTLDVYNTIGQTIFSESGVYHSGANRISVNTSGLNSGVYFYSIDIDGQKVSKSFIIE